MVKYEVWKVGQLSKGEEPFPVFKEYESSNFSEAFLFFKEYSKNNASVIILNKHINEK